MRQNEKHRQRNRLFASRARTYVRKARLALEEGEPQDARQATMEAVSALDKAAEKGILHKKNASRRKSRLMKRLAALENSAK
jgi:small subunit ribosomal protein S20